MKHIHEMTTSELIEYHTLAQFSFRDDMTWGVILRDVEREIADRKSFQKFADNQPTPEQPSPSAALATALAEVARLEAEVGHLTKLLKMPQIKVTWVSLFEFYKRNNRKCHYCEGGNGDLHDDDCVMLTILALMDGNYD